MLGCFKNCNAITLTRCGHAVAGSTTVPPRHCLHLYATLIAVCVRLEGTVALDTDVVRLFLGERGHLRSKRRQMQIGDLLVEVLRQQVHLILVGLGLLPILQQVKLRKHLIGERTRHHERGVSSGAPQVHQAASSKDDDAMPVREDEAVDLRFNVLYLDSGEALESSHVDLVVKVPDVADDGIVLHVLHVGKGDDVEVASCRSEDVDLPHNILHANHLKALHASLQRADGVDLSDQDTGASSPQGVSTSLAHIAIAAHQCPLAADHNICGTHDAIWEGMPASVHVVELRLGHAIVNSDGWPKQLAF